MSDADPALGTVRAATPFASGRTSGATSGTGPAEARADVDGRTASRPRGDARAGEVRYGLEIDGADRPWDVVDVRAVESVSAPYEAVITLVTDHEAAETDALLGRSAELEWTCDGATSRMCGVIARVDVGRAAPRATLARVRLVPAFEALRYRVQSRIFQHKTAPEILAEVLRTGLAPYGRSVRFGLQRVYPQREYAVQYEESDFDFVHRLCEEEGISYRFAHESFSEEMVLFDANSALERMDGAAGGLAYYVHGGDPSGSTAGVAGFEIARRIGAQRVTTLDYDWTEPRVVTDRARGAANAAPVQEHRRALTVGGYAVPRYQRNDARVQSDLRSEARNADLATAQGRGNVASFRAGVVFELSGHGRPELDGTYVLTRVEHDGRQSAAGVDYVSPDASDVDYGNRFAAVPHDVPLRPARRTPKPRVHGVQTATVVGPPGEEIHTDEHGRIKCKFHWDAAPAGGDHASCWIRVAQAWAGQGWGFVFLPRVGMEVVVSFVEGDPDRPLVTGCVYNGVNTPQYALPGEKTKSYVRTQSTPGNDSTRYNELRFDDAAGSEEVFVHAQRDYNEVVENDHTTTVHANQTNRVIGNQVNAVTLNQIETVGGNQALAVACNRTQVTHQNEAVAVGGTRTTTVTGKETVALRNDRQMDITGEDVVTVHASRTVTIQQDLVQTVVAGDRTEIIQTGGRNTHVKETDTTSAKNKHTIVDEQFVSVATLAYKVFHKNSGLVMTEDHIDLSAKDYLQLVSNGGTAAIKLAPDGRLSLMAREELSLSCGAASIVLKKDGTVEIAGPKRVSVTSAGSSLELTPEGATLNGASVTSAATGVHMIQGALVKIN